MLRQKIQDFIGSRREPGGENFLFPSRDWKYEVENGDTTAGMDVWLEGKVEIETDEAIDAIDRFLNISARPFIGDMSEIEFNEAVLDICGSLRILDDEAADRARQFLQKDPEDFVFGEICGNIPSDMIFDISRIMHLGMIAYEGRCSPEKMDEAIVAFADRHDVEAEAIQLTRSRLGRDNPGATQDMP